MADRGTKKLKGILGSPAEQKYASSLDPRYTYEPVLSNVAESSIPSPSKATEQLSKFVANIVNVEHDIPPELEDLSSADLEYRNILGIGHDGEVYKFQCRGYPLLVAKWSKDGLSSNWEEFMKVYLKGRTKKVSLMEESSSFTMPLRGLIPVGFRISKGRRFIIHRFLSEEHRDDVKMSEEELAKSLVKEVRALHALGFNHMDIAPRNVILTEHGLFLIDSNLVTPHHRLALMKLPLDVTSPRIRCGKPVEPRDDLYGLKITLLHFGISEEVIHQALGPRDTELLRGLEEMAERIRLVKEKKKKKPSEEEAEDKPEGKDNESPVDLNKQGDEYYYGNGVPEDKTEAVKLYRLAAESGLAVAQHNIGHCLQYGEGTDVDKKEAVKWYQLAAQQGFAKAQCKLGSCLKNGTGIEKDYKEAVKWYRRAADQGHAEGQFKLGSMTYDGHGTEENEAEGVRLCKLAAEQGHPKAQYSLGMEYESGSTLDRNLEEALKWYRLAAEQGHAKAQCKLGSCLKNGTGIEKDYKEAVKWYRRAADQGHAEGQFKLGSMTYDGHGTEENEAEGVRLCKLASEQGHPKAQYSLGMLHLNGIVLEQSLNEAVRYFHAAAEGGDADGLYELGKSFHNGRGVGMNLKEAVRLYHKAADQGHSDAQYHLGMCYFNGRGVQANKNEARKYVGLAAEQDHAEAQNMYGML